MNDLLASSYFNPKGKESASQVNARYGQPFLNVTLYRHLKLHWSHQLEKAKRIAVLKTRAPNKWEKLTQTVEVVESPVGALQPHEEALDAFIQAGRMKLGADDMTINAANLIAAIKTKADIEAKTKDRRLDMLKSMFVGMGPGENKNDKTKALPNLP